MSEQKLKPCPFCGGEAVEPEDVEVVGNVLDNADLLEVE